MKEIRSRGLGIGFRVMGFRYFGLKGLGINWVLNSGPRKALGFEF